MVDIVNDVEWLKYWLETLTKFILASNSSSKSKMNTVLKSIALGDKKGNWNTNVLHDVLCKRTNLKSWCNMRCHGIMRCHDVEIQYE